MEQQKLRAGRERIGIGIVIGIGSGDGDREMEREGVPTGASWEHTVMRRSGLSCVLRSPLPGLSG
ncbi:hypothetical protein DAI22_07g121500 [Oryza sativa Japonica Group]|nr:hypothetical protein DAI22_07g121500 [Oryza sativa Japonica Group]